MKMLDKDDLFDSSMYEDNDYKSELTVTVDENEFYYENKQKENVRKEKAKKQKIKGVYRVLIWIIIVVTMIICLVTASFVIQKVSKIKSVTPNKRVTIELDTSQLAIEDEMTKTKEQIDEMKDGGYTEIFINFDIILNSDGECEVDFRNSKYNKYSQYFELFEKDTGEMLYQSGYIKTGMGVNKIKLNKILSTGKHACIVNFYNYNENKGEVVGKTSADVEIEVN